MRAARRTVRLVAVVGLLAVLAGAPATAAHADPGTDRVAAMVAAMDAGHPYVEAQAVGGDAELWRDRLQRGIDAADFPAPLLVAAWVSSDDLAPQPALYSHTDTALADAGLVDGVYLFTVDGFPDIAAHGLDRDVAHRAARLGIEAENVVDEAERLAGRSDVELGTLAITRTWAFLLLAAPDPPSPVALARRLSGDPTIFTDHRYVGPPLGAGGDDVDPLATSLLVIVGAMVGGYLVVRAARALTTRPRRPAGVPEPVLVATPSSSEVERMVTALATAVSEADARPGVLAYDRAQTCLDAAEAYADHPAERDRIGVALLCADGREWLAGRTPARRCYFNPRHLAVTEVSRGSLSVPCCARCAGLARSGKEPFTLRVAEHPGDAVGRLYYEVADVWTTTGYGALSDDWAEQVHRAALEQR